MKRTVMIFAVAFAFLMASAGMAHAQQHDNKNTQKDPAVTTASNNNTNDTSASDNSKGIPAPIPNDPAYVIGAEDVLDINVWKEPDVSRLVPVRPDGRISIPLINDVQAAGLTPQQLAAMLTEKLRKFINGPQVTVIVTAMNSQRIFVVGEVARAGAFPMLPGMTVLQALSSSGGFTTFADVKRIHVLRMRDGKQIELPFNYRDVLKGEKPEQNIKLEPGDTIVVP